jgi:hypothetical protein
LEGGFAYYLSSLLLDDKRAIKRTTVTTPVVEAPAMDIVSGLSIAFMTETTVEITVINKQTVRILLVFDILKFSPLFSFHQREM